MPTKVIPIVAGGAFRARRHPRSAAVSSRTRWAGRCATCASRSPTAATSAASTACRAKCSTPATSSCRMSAILTFEEIARLAAHLRRPGRQEDPPHRRRAAGAHATSTAWSRCSRELPTWTSPSPPTARCSRSRRVALQAGRPRPRHREPRLARRRDLPRDERRRLSGGQGARGHRGRGRRGARAGQDQHGGEARHERPRHRGDGAALARHAATSCASSSTWTSARTNGWRMDDVVPSAEVVRRDHRELAARAGRRQLPRRSRRALALPRRRGEIGVISSVTQAFCCDCNALRLSTEGKLYTCLFATAGPRPASARCAAARATTRSATRSPPSGSAAPTATPRSALRRPRA